MELDLIAGILKQKPSKAGAASEAPLQPDMVLPKSAGFTEMFNASSANVSLQNGAAPEKAEANQLPNQVNLSDFKIPLLATKAAEETATPAPLPLATPEPQDTQPEPPLPQAEADTPLEIIQNPEFPLTITAPLQIQMPIDTKASVAGLEATIPIGTPLPPVMKVYKPDSETNKPAPELAVLPPIKQVPATVITPISSTLNATTPPESTPSPILPLSEPRSIQPSAPQGATAVITPSAAAPVTTSKVVEAGNLVISDDQTELPFNIRIDRQPIVSPTITHSVTRNHSAPPLPEQISTQLQQLLTKADKQTIELRLDPPELGRVTIHMSTHDQQMTAHVSAERADTADLMRRHADLLAATLEKAGFSQANLSFQQGGSRQNRQGFTGISVQDLPAEMDSAAELPSLQAGLNGRLDIRL